MLAVVCAAAYFASCSVGFLLDDFVHVDYATRAWHGDWQGFLHAFGGNWTGRTDNLTSYRPAISISFLIDALVWQANAFGYHLTNVVMFIGSCILVRMISLELSTLVGLKLGRPAAFLAALLFAVYPLHPESVAWVIGRVDVQCGLFYLGAILAYLRARRLKKSTWLVVSLLSFLAALPSKEMAVTLPAVVLLAEALLFFRQEKADGQRNVQRTGGEQPQTHEGLSSDGLPPRPRPYAHYVRESLQSVVPFWLLLGAYAVLRTALIGTLVGGYGGSFQECWRNFLDNATLNKIFFPVSEEIGMPPVFKNMLGGLYFALAGTGIARVCLRSLEWRSLLFLGTWAVVAVLPAFQIWHIYPNLVGSRLFFLPSAPFCILFSFVAIPVLSDCAKQRLITLTGSVILLAISSLWAALLQLNLEPYVVAGRRMDNIRAQVASIAAETPVGERTLFLDLPQDYQGAGLLGRPEFLEMLARLPFVPQDYSNRVLTIESPVAGSREDLYPDTLKRILANPRLHAVYQWDADAGQFALWRPAGGARRYHFAAGEASSARARWEPADVRPVLSTRWSSCSHSVARVVIFPHHITVYPGSSGVTLILPDLAIDPRQVQVVSAQLRCTAGDTTRGAPPESKLRFVWTTPAQAGGEEVRSEAAFDEAGDGMLRFYAARSRAWSLGRKIDSAGLRFLPGDYRAELYGLDLAGSETLVPRLRLVSESDHDKNADPYSAWLFKAVRGESVFAACDLSQIPGAAGCRLVVTKSGKVFASGASPAQVSADELEKVSGVSLATPCGRVRLPEPLFEQPGLRQVRLVALDASGNTIGWPSNPQTISIAIK